IARRPEIGGGEVADLRREVEVTEGRQQAIGGVGAKGRLVHGGFEEPRLAPPLLRDEAGMAAGGPRHPLTRYFRRPRHQAASASSSPSSSSSPSVPVVSPSSRAAAAMTALPMAL